MKTSLKAPVTIGSLFVLAVGIAVSTAWSPPVGDENVIVPAGQYITSAGPIESNDPATTANVLSTVPALVVGSNNDNYRTGTTADAGPGLIVGKDNKLSTRLTSFFSSIIGTNNNVRSQSSLVVGTNNEVCIDATGLVGYTAPSKNSLVAGYGHLVEGGAEGVAAGGRFNTVRADNSLVVGQSNTVEGATTGTKAATSVALGGSNHIMSTVGWTMGSTNEITGVGGTALGVGLTADSYCAVVAGTFNEPTGGDLDSAEPGDPVFVVGNGTSALEPSNAFVVKRNGDVIITKAQGDISMGIYGD